MSIQIEDGTGIVGANSFVTVADFRTYAAARGVTLPAGDAEVEVLLIKAMDYLAEMETRFIGAKLEELQELPWPRMSVPNVSPPYWWEEIIPPAIKKAQMALAIHALAGPLTVANRPDDKGAVTGVEVGPVKTTYAAPKVAFAQPRFDDVTRLLGRLLRGGSSALLASRG